MSGIGDLSFVKGSGGLGREAAGKDHYCGIVVYSDTKPANWPTSLIKEFTAMSDVEDAGIAADATDDEVKKLHYHLAKFFDIYNKNNAKARIWVMIADVPEISYDYAEITTLVDASNGDIRLVALQHPDAFATTQVTAIQSVLDTLEGNHKPVSVLMTADFSAVSDLSALDDLKALDSKKVSVVIGQDGAGDGKTLFDTLQSTVSNLGSVLGWASWKNVSWNLGWVEQFNVVINSEFDTPAFANADLVSENLTLLDGIHDKGYIFLIKRVGVTGTYFNDAPTCVAATSDYAYLENNQVIDKAIRGTYEALAPKINSPLQIDSETGKLDELTISHFENLASKPLDSMVSAAELSGYSVFIDPDQDVQSTSKLKITLTLVINGVARNIEVNISFSKTA